jgi:ADP-ribose pyrophosphatase YjhB (NUDIX family)
MSLNPALDDVSHCPRCAGAIRVSYPHSVHCEVCGYEAYWNPKPVAAAIPVTPDGKVILLRRGFNPGKGLWTMPGGFVDLGESVEQAAVREAREELEISVELTGLVGVYSNPDDRIVLIVHSARTSDLPRTTPEATEILIVDPSDIPWQELAFPSTDQALRDWAERI